MSTVDLILGVILPSSVVGIKLDIDQERHCAPL